MAITRGDVEHAARLSRLELEQEEIELFTGQLGRIVDYVDKLSKLGLEGVEPMAHAAERCPLREDEPGETLSRDESLKGAPLAFGGFFKVPPIIE